MFILGLSYKYTYTIGIYNAPLIIWHMQHIEGYDNVFLLRYIQ